MSLRKAIHESGGVIADIAARFKTAILILPSHVTVSIVTCAVATNQHTGDASVKTRINIKGMSSFDNGGAA